MKIGVPVVALVATIFSAGCSTITQSENQSIALTATYKGKPVMPTCHLRNDKGSWNSRAPGHVTVRKSNDDLRVTCQKEGMPDGLLKAVSRSTGSMWGNIIFGGGVGAIMDHNNGTGYDYPDRLPVRMGESVVVDRKPKEQAAQVGCTPGIPC